MRHFDLNKRKNKLKEIFHEDGCYYSIWFKEYWLSSKSMYCCRPIRTKQERTKYIQTEDEKYYKVKYRAKRSVRGLPSNWDDIWTGANDVKKSWKHNSKRKRQWKYE